MAISFLIEPEVIVPKSDELKYKVQVSDFMNVVASKAIFEVTCTAFSGNLLIAGQTVSVTGVSGADTAQSLATQIKTLYNLSTFVVTVAGNIVTCEDTEYKILTNYTFNMYASGCTFTSSNGVAGVPKNSRLWYQFVIDNAPFSAPSFANLIEQQGTANGYTFVDAKEVAYMFLRTPIPSYTQTDPVPITSYLKQIRIRCGTIQTVSNTTVYSQAVESNAFTVFNTVFQPINEQKLAPYTGSPLVKWLCSKPHYKIQITNNSFEWANIALPTGRFRIKYTFYYEGISEVFNIDTGNITSSVYQIPIGTANTAIKPYIGDCIRYTAQIWYFNGTTETAAYSEVITKQITNVCFKDEIYFIDDLGCFATLQFDQISEKETGFSSSLIETRKDPVSTTATAIMPLGGRSSVINQSNPTMTMLSQRYRESDDMVCYFEEFFNSPVHYKRVVRILSNGTTAYAMRKITIQREATQLFKKEEYAQYKIKFNYATDAEVQ